VAEQKVSLIMTVFNEAGNIEALLDSLCAQTRPPDEIVIVDGGSTDSTPAKIRDWQARNPDLPLNLIVQPGANISQGRNAAISAASHEIIAATDAGVRLRHDWLSELSAPFAKPGVAAVAGFFRADPKPDSPFEIAMGATVLPAEPEIKPEKFLPSSRSVAFKRTVWEKAGGYPEWLDYCEDLIFDMNVLASGYRFEWQPRALAHFATRRNLADFYKQYYRYARGDGKANLFFKRHLLRYAIYLIFLPGLAWFGFYRRLAWLLLIVSAVGYLRKPYQRLFGHLDEFQKLPVTAKIAALGWVPVIRAVGDIAKMVGYPVGVVWRLRRKP
jgi:glycosyltransferase involved in cell wall biosynthesis